MKYRSEQVNEHMMLLEFLLTAISERKMSKLKVAEILAEDDDQTLDIDKAMIIGMQRTANESMVAIKALAIGLDRVTAMVEQMAQEMDNANMPNGERYKSRLEILLNFKRIMDELNPTLAHRFAQM